MQLTNNERAFLKMLTVSEGTSTTRYTKNNDYITNPLPEGATWKDENLITGWDGGLYVEGDPRAEAPQ